MSSHELKSSGKSLSPDILGYIAIAMSFFVPYFAIPVAVVARRRARDADIHSTPAEWGWILSISITALMILVIVAGFIVSVVVPLLS
jgi:uncharacterized membrane protein YhaH (DUF805 family)